MCVTAKIKVIQKHIQASAFQNNDAGLTNKQCFFFFFEVTLECSLASYLLMQPSFVLLEHHKFNVLQDVAFLLYRSLKMELNYK